MYQEEGVGWGDSQEFNSRSDISLRKDLLKVNTGKGEGEEGEGGREIATK